MTLCWSFCEKWWEALKYMLRSAVVYVTAHLQQINRKQRWSLTVIGGRCGQQLMWHSCGPFGSLRQTLEPLEVGHLVQSLWSRFSSQDFGKNSEQSSHLRASQQCRFSCIHINLAQIVVKQFRLLRNAWCPDWLIRNFFRIMPLCDREGKLTAGCKRSLTWAVSQWPGVFSLKKSLFRAKTGFALGPSV